MQAFEFQKQPVAQDKQSKLSQIFKVNSSSLQLPPGLTYIQQFISKQQQLQLLKSILNTQKWNTSLKRRTQHYGFQYKYDRKNEVQEVQPIPIWAIEIKRRIESKARQIRRKQFKQRNQKQYQKNKLIITEEQDLDKICFNQLIINQYEPGQGINAHIDNPTLFSDIVVSLSLASQCVMIFEKGQMQIPIRLKRRSIVVLDGQARYEWKHSIPARKKDNGKIRKTRYSLTFRIMKKEK